MQKKSIIACTLGLAISASYIIYSSYAVNSVDGAQRTVGVEFKEGESSISEKSAVKFKEGKHYVSIDPIYGLPENSVVEVLWYGCPYCLKMEDVIKSDEFKSKSEGWNFQQVHLAKKDGPIGFDFKVYAALKQMGLEGTVGKKYMKALHKDRLSRGSFGKFASEHGISIDAVEELGSNEEAESYFQFISQFSDRKEFKGVPSFVVNGKYIIDNRYEIADVANYLLEKDSQSTSLTEPSTIQ